MQVIICGDSWTAGEWNECGDRILHGGISQYFKEDNFDVVNIGYPGGTNLTSVIRLDNWLNLNTHNNDTIILFFLTEFFREIWHYTNLNNSSQPVNLDNELNRSYTEIKDSWVYRPYYRLQELAEKYNTKLYLVGGASDTIFEYDDFSIDFPNLKIACQSTTNLLVNDNPNVEEPVMCEFLNDWTSPFLKSIKPDDALLTDMDLGKARIKTMKQNPQWFWPDGIHPNRQGHLKLYKYLKNFIMKEQQ